MKMNSGYVLVKISTIQQLPYRIFNVKSIFSDYYQLLF